MLFLLKMKLLNFIASFLLANIGVMHVLLHDRLLFLEMKVLSLLLEMKKMMMMTFKINAED